jgi:RNA polymerase sigma factor (sigma-70 family)
VNDPFKLDLPALRDPGNERFSAAWQDLHDRFDPGLREHLQRRGEDPDAAADLAQEAWVRLQQAIHRYSNLALPGLLHTMARNLQIDAHRKAQSRARTAKAVRPDPTADFPEDEILDRITQGPYMEALAEARGTLTPHENHWLDLVFDEGLTHAEVAARLGLKDKQGSKVLKTRVVKKLRKALLVAPGGQTPESKGGRV